MKYIFTCMAFFAVLLLSCQRNNNEQSVKDDKKVPASVSQEVNKNMQDSQTVSINTAVPGWDKKLIKTADITIQLKDYHPYNNTLHKNLKQFGAYVANETQTQNDYRIENNISIKVPVLLFDDFVNALQSDSVKVLQKNITSTDVTTEIYDTKARTALKKKVRERYEDLVKQARNTKELLDLQNEINDVQVDIESTEGRAKYLSQQTVYSTVNLRYYQDLAETVKPNDSFWSKLKEGFSNGGNIIGTTLLVLINIWPLVLVAAIGWYLVRKIKQRRLAPTSATNKQ